MGKDINIVCLVVIQFTINISLKKIDSIRGQWDLDLECLLYKAKLEQRLE